ncbi:hypothetical protein HPB52_015406 [Rhipicephalus sanguineus]|uniref:Tick transposon n=1 Tax=Rhipicephalus sanguineus TaxID=34632 RepID=A0A9D4PRZ8_RHISA|nr:hypothetical protein HPB52_015406 [Rhipicephalus sanguineus]
MRHIHNRAPRRPQPRAPSGRRMSPSQSGRACSSLTSPAVTLGVAVVWPAERRHRLRGAPSPLCGDCGEEETLQHLLISCTALAPQREHLARAFRRQGLPCATMNDVLHPADRVRGALRAVLEYIDAAQLADRL